MVFAKILGNIHQENFRENFRETENLRKNKNFRKYFRENENFRKHFREFSTLKFNLPEAASFRQTWYFDQL
jgi:hypothetical protein